VIEQSKLQSIKNTIKELGRMQTNTPLPLLCASGVNTPQIASAQELVIRIQPFASWTFDNTIYEVDHLSACAAAKPPPPAGEGRTGTIQFLISNKLNTSGEYNQTRGTYASNSPPYPLSDPTPGTWFLL